MPDIFINYRTGDEEASAGLIDLELSRRFGPDRIFRAGKSIPPGENYIHQLLTAARDSEVLLAVIGPRWLTAVDERGRNRLYDETDWIRREILTAFEHGGRVIPVLVGRTPRLRRSDLPPELARLADCQYRRLDHRRSAVDLRALGDDLAELVPALAEHDQDREPAAEAGDGPGPVALRAGDHAQQQLGGTNTVVNDPRAPVHTGSGHQITGDGVNYVAGRNSGGIHQTFGAPREHPDGGR